MILERISVPRLQQVEVRTVIVLPYDKPEYQRECVANLAQDLDDTTRGAGGFGSTGGFGPASKKQKIEDGGAAAEEAANSKKE